MQTFMNAKNVHLFDKKAASMDHDHSPGRVPDYGFAFNDSEFSDKLLRIESVVDLPDFQPHVDGNLSLSNGAGSENLHWEDMKNIIGDEDADIDGENRATKADGVKVQQVTTLHISSTILASKSPFFSKLFSNPVMESEQKHVTLRINASEESALLELLNFMYSNKLSVFTPIAVLGVLMAAHKFEVVSCTRYCSHILRSFPMTPESALLYLDLPRNVLMNEAVRPLTDAAKQFLGACYKDIEKSQNEVMELPLAGFGAILASDDLQVASEDVVYGLTLKWARTHYPKLEERQEILSSRLAPLIRFPLMSCRKLRKVLTCNDFNTELASKLVLEALFFKSEPLYYQRNQTPGDAESTRRFVDRAYKYRPVKVIELELPQPQCVVYMDLKREECEALFPSGRVYSQSFHLCGHRFFLSAHCNTDPQNSIHCFGLFLGMQEKGSASLAVGYEFSARSKSTEGFVAKYRGTYTFSSGKVVGYRNLLGISWSSFVADGSQYFINDNLHLRAELTMKSQVLHINPEMS